MRKFLLSLLLLFVITGSIAQKKSCVWQGKLRLPGGAVKEMSIKLELVMDGINCAGVLYTRGVDKGAVFGCDYIVTGSHINEYFNLRQIKIIRSVLVGNAECDAFNKLILRHQPKDTLMNVTGTWFWKSEDEAAMNLTSVNDEISETTLDEISAYRTEVYKFYEEKSIFLIPAERISHLYYETEVDSTDLIIDITAPASSKADSLQVFFNGESITDSYPLTSGQLRLRIKSIPPGMNELIVINTSQKLSKHFFSIGFTQHGKTKNSTGEISFVRNALFILNRRE
jgi:hypothetical protein